uniref:Uncharacterized protein n=1 Tax=Solanum tuberosum TaxID=4113 RepID=M1DTU7_SOLTU
MTFMKNNSRSTASKATSSKFSTEVEGILDVTFGSFGVVTRNKAATLGQQTLQVSSASTPVFGSLTPKEQVPPQMLWKEETVLLKRSRRHWLYLTRCKFYCLPQGRTMIQLTNHLHVHRVM